MNQLDAMRVRGITVAFALTRPGDRRGTSRDLLAVLSRAPVERIASERCPRCREPHGRLTTPFGVASASHAAGHTAVAFAAPDVTAGPIGVDIEDATEADAKLAGLSTVLGEDFPSAIDALRRWTEIEAILKADGRGLDVEPRSVRLETVAAVRLGWVADRPADRFEIDALPLDPPIIGSLARPTPQP